MTLVFYLMATLTEHFQIIPDIMGSIMIFVVNTPPPPANISKVFPAAFTFGDDGSHLSAEPGELTLSILILGVCCACLVRAAFPDPHRFP
jgi:hypothetical protein